MNISATEELLLQRHTVRSFKDQTLTDEQYTRLMEAARFAPTSEFLQQCSIIRVTDSHLREQIRTICHLDYVGANGDLLVFVVDMYRNHRIRAQLGLADDGLSSTDLFIQAMEDTLIAAQNVVIAAESMGLGSVYLGSIQNDIRPIIQMLKLPKLTFPLVGLQVGVPEKRTQVKPRMPLPLRSFENQYQDEFNLQNFAEYDAIVETYYGQRDSNQRIDSFTKQIADKISRKRFKRDDILAVIHEQGFCQY